MYVPDTEIAKLLNQIYIFLPIIYVSLYHKRLNRIQKECTLLESNFTNF